MGSWRTDGRRSAAGTSVAIPMSTDSSGTFHGPVDFIPHGIGVGISGGESQVQDSMGSRVSPILNSRCSSDERDGDFHPELAPELVRPSILRKGVSVRDEKRSGHHAAESRSLLQVNTSDEALREIRRMESFNDDFDSESVASYQTLNAAPSPVPVLQQSSSSNNAPILVKKMRGRDGSSLKNKDVVGRGSREKSTIRRGKNVNLKKLKFGGVSDQIAAAASLNRTDDSSEKEDEKEKDRGGGGGGGGGGGVGEKGKGASKEVRGARRSDNPQAQARDEHSRTSEGLDIPILSGKIIIPLVVNSPIRTSKGPFSPGSSTNNLNILYSNHDSSTSTSASPITEDIPEDILLDSTSHEKKSYLPFDETEGIEIISEHSKITSGDDEIFSEEDFDGFNSLESNDGFASYKDSPYMTATANSAHTAPSSLSSMVQPLKTADTLPRSIFSASITGSPKFHCDRKRNDSPHLTRKGFFSGANGTDSCTGTGYESTSASSPSRSTDCMSPLSPSKKKKKHLKSKSVCQTQNQNSNQNQIQNQNQNQINITSHSNSHGHSSSNRNSSSCTNSNCDSNSPPPMPTPDENSLRWAKEGSRPHSVILTKEGSRPHSGILTESPIRSPGRCVSSKRKNRDRERDMVVNINNHDNDNDNISATDANPVAALHFIRNDSISSDLDRICPTILDSMNYNNNQGVVLSRHSSSFTKASVVSNNDNSNNITKIVRKLSNSNVEGMIAGGAGVGGGSIKNSVCRMKESRDSTDKEKGDQADGGISVNPSKVSTNLNAGNGILNGGFASANSIMKSRSSLRDRDKEKEKDSRDSQKDKGSAAGGERVRKGSMDGGYGQSPGLSLSLLRIHGTGTGITGNNNINNNANSSGNGNGNGNISAIRYNEEKLGMGMGAGVVSGFGNEKSKASMSQSDKDREKELESYKLCAYESDYPDDDCSVTSISVSQSMSAQQLERKNSSIKEDFEEEVLLLDPTVLEEHTAAVTSLRWYFFAMITISLFQATLIKIDSLFYFLSVGKFIIFLF